MKFNLKKLNNAPADIKRLNHKNSKIQPLAMSHFTVIENTIQLVIDLNGNNPEVLLKEARVKFKTFSVLINEANPGTEKLKPFTKYYSSLGNSCKV